MRLDTIEACPQKKGGNRKERLQHKAMRTAALTHNTYIYRYRLHLTRQESGLIV